MSEFRAIALVCSNGHLLTGDVHGNPGEVTSYCSVCGAVTHNSCTDCDASIPGDHLYKMEWTEDIQPGEQIGKAPQFCNNCGVPYLWTNLALNSARELIQEFDLSEDDRSTLSDSIPDLLVETPKSELAMAKYRRVMGKAGKEAGGMMQRLLEGVVAETIKRILFPSKVFFYLKNP